METQLQLFQLLIQGGSFAVLVWVVWWVFTKTVPTLITSFEVTLKEQRKDFIDALRANTEALQEVTESLGELAILVHKDRINRRDMIDGS